MDQLTVGQLIELLRQYQEDTVVLIQGYETGWDSVHAIRQSEVVEYRKAHDWDGEYQEAKQFRQPVGQRPAVLIEGRRGHWRGGNPNQ